MVIPAHSVDRGHNTAHNTLARYLFYLSSRDVVKTERSRPCLVTQNSVPRRCERYGAAAGGRLVAVPFK
ncbi:uncharacterized [Tachysurus ichikawai]